MSSLSLKESLLIFISSPWKRRLFYWWIHHIDWELNFWTRQASPKKRSRGKFFPMKSRTSITWLCQISLDSGVIRSQHTIAMLHKVSLTWLAACCFSRQQPCMGKPCWWWEWQHSASGILPYQSGSHFMTPATFTDVFASVLGTWVCISAQHPKICLCCDIDE